MNVLPNKLSELLSLAVDDCEAIEKKSNYKFNMWRWFDTTGDICTVCMAGAVLVNTCGINLPANHIALYDILINILFENNIGSELKKFLAIDKIRSGYFRDAYYLLNDISPSKSQEEALSAAYYIIRNNFYENGNEGRTSWEDYRAAAKVLAEVGL